MKAGMIQNKAIIAKLNPSAHPTISGSLPGTRSNRAVDQEMAPRNRPEAPATASPSSKNKAALNEVEAYEEGQNLASEATFQAPIPNTASDIQTQGPINARHPLAVGCICKSC
jgi:hypothetical protein